MFIWRKPTGIHLLKQTVRPSDLEPGTHELLVGTYLLSTGDRLPLLDVDGDVVGDDISLGRVRVKAP